MKEWGDTVNERPLQGAASPTARTCVSGSEEESLPYPLTELLLPLLTTQFCSSESFSPQENVPTNIDNNGSAEPTGGNGVTLLAGMMGA